MYIILYQLILGYCSKVVYLRALAPFLGMGLSLFLGGNMQEINYRIGLDIGIASVGWAALLNDEHNEPVHILDMGVRVFDKAENPKDGSALAVPRRNNRTARRRQRRKN